jgi:putative endonuclease
MSTKILGKYGELLAEEYLKGQGYQILELNFKNKIGEIDIIFKDKGVICFCEVKTRRGLEYGQPYEAVNYYKVRKLSNLALSYLKFKYSRVDIFARFDVISILCQPDSAPKIEHIKHAFDLCS